MELFEHVFDRSSIYGSLFFNITAVIEYPDLKDLEKSKPELYSQWEFLCKTKYKMQNNVELPGMGVENLLIQDLYNQYAIYYPEYCKIVGITFANVYSEDQKIKRNFNKIFLNEELEIIETFQNVLLQISSDGQQSTPHYFPTLCGHNIINHDIPLFLKRLIMYRNDLKVKSIPLILKKYLQAKPWDSDIVDTYNIWKFNGKDYTSLNLISEFMGLKRNVEILSTSGLSEYYWENIEKEPEKTLDFIALQSANEMNLVIQMINELRQF